MSFCLYPEIEVSCPDVAHCPHLGGAALGSLVLIANNNLESNCNIHRTIDGERDQNEKFLNELQRLERELAQVKLESELERQNKFATNQQEQGAAKPAEDPPSLSPPETPKKRGAPVGHPGWFRATPTEYDWSVGVPAPRRCPHCQGVATVVKGLSPSEHLQKDLSTESIGSFVTDMQRLFVMTAGVWLSSLATADS